MIDNNIDKEFKFHEEYRDIAQILIDLNSQLKKKDIDKERIISLNKRAVKRVKELLDLMYKDSEE